MRRENLMILVMFITISALIIIGLTSGHSNTKYTIETEHGKYYTNQFRICGKGIAFDTDSKKVIVLGNFNIISNLE
jgi:hypothetical protein